MKIAFLFLIQNDINFPEIWNNYFNNNFNKINIYCHPKNKDNVKTSWLKNNIIKDLAPTKWGYLTKAIRNLLKTSIKNKENKQFILISESCIPINTFNNFYLFCNDFKKSYINFRQFDDINIKKSFLSKNYFKNIKLIKHSQWFCLSRHHVKKLLNNKNLPLFDKVLAGDENILSLISDCNNIINYSVTYVN